MNAIKTRETRSFWHVTLDGSTVYVAKRVGEGKMTEADAIAKARRIRNARNAQS